MTPMNYEKPAQKTSDTQRGKHRDLNVLRRFLRRYHNSLYCMISIPLYLLLGACIMSVLPSELIPQMEMTPKVVHSSMKDTL